jgi:hypothetical protein
MQMTGFNFTAETSCKVCRDHLFLDRRMLTRVDSHSHRLGSSLCGSVFFFPLGVSARLTDASPDILKYCDDPDYGTLRTAQVSLVM